MRGVRSRLHQLLMSDHPQRPPEVESTIHLIARARAGDQEAVERLFARHLGPLRRWASGRLPKWARDLADTDDLVQDTLLRTLKRIDGFDPRGAGALQGYLRQAIVNAVRDELRKKSRRPDAAGLDTLEADSRLSPLEQAIGQEALARYEQALAQLTLVEREAIIGRVEMGYTYEELAEVLGKPTAEAARKTAQRALLRLAAAMERSPSNE
jgi:RNA polymerase sigma factor (sigma-70 family)